MKLLEVIHVEEARRKILEAMEALDFKKTEKIKTEDALGRILGQDIFARENVPAFRKSTMDGYAVQSKSTQGATVSIPSVLEIVETIEMGQLPRKKISPSQASVIYTGGMLPEGADAVIPVEQTEKIGEKMVGVYAALSHRENVVDIGEDIQEGSLYFSKGLRITPQVIAACMSIGKKEIEVYKALRIKSISTGDEIVDPGVESLDLAKSRDVNSYAIQAFLEDLGCLVVERKHLPDQKELLKEEFHKDDADMIFISGSSSKGKKDFIPSIMEEEDALLFHGIAIKPGKPTSFARFGDRLVLGLPGHPVSAIAVYLTVFEPAFYRYYGLAEKKSIPARLEENLYSSPGMTKIQFVKADSSSGEWTCQPIFGPSGNLSTLAKANAYIVIEPEEEGVEKGQIVEVHLFSL